MPTRPCIDCGTHTSGTRCPTCRAANRTELDPATGATRSRYGGAHQRERAAWAPMVRAGHVTCRRAPYGLCVAPDPLIAPDEPWQLGHPDAACAAPKAPEHVVCNSGAPNRRT